MKYKPIRIGNLYPSNGQNGDIYATTGVAPCLRSGQGEIGNGIGSCNAPKVLVAQEMPNQWHTMGTIVVTPSDRMERHIAEGGVSRSVRSNVRLEFILYREI